MLSKADGKKYTAQHPDVTFKVHVMLTVAVHHFRRSIHQSRVLFEALEGFEQVALFFFGSQVADAAPVKKVLLVF